MKLAGFVMAVRFVRSYGLEDNLGSIMDHILKHPEKTFNEKLFPEYKPYYDARILIDTKKDNKLTINSENIVLEINSSDNFEKDFNNFLEAYDKIILKEIFKEYGIMKIDRFGCVLKSIEKEGSELCKDIEDVLKKHNKLPDSLAVRFNCVNKTPKTIKDFVTTDYENQIISYDRKTRKDDLNLFVDYQKYYQPPLEKISDAEILFTDFSKSSLKNFKDRYLNK
jgi:hypothetical protein